MNTNNSSALDRAMARVCELCPACMHARHHQRGMIFGLVKSIENRVCPFCRAYERVNGRKAHEALPRNEYSGKGYEDAP